MNQAKKAIEALPTESIDMGSYFVDVSLEVEEPTIERLPPMKKKRVGSRREWSTSIA